jgi:hypothetical protein
MLSDKIVIEHHDIYTPLIFNFFSTKLQQKKYEKDECSVQDYTMPQETE